MLLLVTKEMIQTLSELTARLWQHGKTDYNVISFNYMRHLRYHKHLRATNLLIISFIMFGRRGTAQRRRHVLRPRNCRAPELTPFSFCFVCTVSN